MSTASAGEPAQRRTEADVEFARIVAFSDGVFAIAITLLVLALEIPSDAPDLVEALRDRGDELFAYAVSFAVLGKLWLAHHRFFSSLERFDNFLMGLNLLYLAWVALIPFTSEVLGDFSDESAGVIVYAVSMIGVSLTFLLQIVYAYRRDLVSTEHLALRHRFAGPANFVVPIVFAASIPLALASPTAATLMWLVIFLAGRRLGDVIARRREPA